MKMKYELFPILLFKRYHIAGLLIISIFFLNSCALNPDLDQGYFEQKDRQDSFEAEKKIEDQSLQQLKNTYPDAFNIYQQAVSAESLGQLDAAIELYHKAMQQAPEDGLLLTRLGLAYLRKEDVVPARRYLLKAVSFDPDYYKPRLGLGYIYLQNRQPQKAVSQLEKSLELLTTIEGTFLLGEAFETLGELSKARELYQRVVRFDNKHKLGKEAVIRLRSMEK